MSKDNINQEDYFVYNQAIQDLTEKIRTICASYDISTDRKTGDLIYAHSDGTWHNLLSDITEQMKKSVEEMEMSEEGVARIRGMDINSEELEM